MENCGVGKGVVKPNRHSRFIRSRFKYCDYPRKLVFWLVSSKQYLFLNIIHTEKYLKSRKVSMRVGCDGKHTHILDNIQRTRHSIRRFFF